MKTSFKYLIGSTLAASALLFTGCGLDEDNPHAGDATLDNYQAWAGMQETCYLPLVTDIFSRSDYMMMAEGGTDLWVSGGNGDGGKQTINYEELSTDNNNSKKLWKMGYQTISTCNTVINEAENISGGNQENIDILVAETKTLRAFYYSLLVAYFGPVTLNLESSSAITGDVDLTPVRTSEKDVYDFIIKELIEAEKVLPVQPYQNNRGRVSKKTAKGLLCRVYAQRAGLGDKFYGDGQTYWKLAKDCAEELIAQKGSYGVDLYTDIADVWADGNNRNNKEALFQIAGADPYSDVYSYEKDRFSNLSVYAGGGFIKLKEFFNPTFYGKSYYPDKASSYYYGRQNCGTWMPSRYLMYCYNPEWDRRWEYTWFYTQSDFTFLDWGGAKIIGHDGVDYEWTADVCTNFGVDASHVGEIVSPYADVSWVDKGAAANQYDVRVWPIGVTDDDASKLLRPAKTSAEFGQPGVIDVTKVYAVPYPVAENDNRIKLLFTHDHLSDAELAKRPYITICIDDMYVDTYPYGMVANGSKADFLPKGNGQTIPGYTSPCLHKFNWAFDGCWTGNMQRKTGDIFIMRLAEIYLIAAEANQKLGDGQAAANYLNPLRERALRKGYAGNYKLTNATEDDVLDEFAREMCGEFMRWTLLKRHNNIAERLALHNKRAAKTFKPYMYNRPISVDFLRVILNADEFGDNGYGTTGTSGLGNFESYK